MRRTLSAVAAILIMAVPSCSLPEQELTSHFQEGQTIQFSAFNGENDINTKTVLIQDGYLDNGQPQMITWWDPHDEIGIFYGASHINKFVSNNTEPVKKAVFEGTLNAFTGQTETGDFNYFWAVYPYNSAVGCDGSSVTAILAHNQVATKGTYASNTNVTIAKSAGLSLAFYNTCSFLRFSVAHEGVKSVTFKGNNNENVAGKFSVSIGNDGKPTAPTILEGQKEITLTAPDGDTFEVGEPYYFVLLPQTFTNGITITFDAETEIGIRNIEASLPFPRNQINFSNGPFDSNIEYTAACSDLSKEGTSNSYIVTKAGYYSFNARVMGNSTRWYNGIPERIDIIWAYGEEVTSTSKYDSEGEYIGEETHYVPQFSSIIDECSLEDNAQVIKFHYTGKAGNVLLAVKDYSGKILWSWHIWCLPQSYGTKTSPNGNYVIMDRNLGALKTAPSGGDNAVYNQFSYGGLLYQWGRKDPIVGIDSNLWSSEDSQATRTIANEKPTTVFGQESLNGNATYDDWCTTSSANEWGTYNSLQLYSKSVHDPCPPGWKLPDERIWSNVSLSQDDNYYGLGIYGLWYDDSCWIPTDGYIWYGRYHGYSCSVWESGDSENNDGSYWIIGSGGAKEFRIHLHAEDGAINYNSHNIINTPSRNLGGSIRCMKE